MGLFCKPVFLSAAMGLCSLAHAQSAPEPLDDSAGPGWQFGGSWTVVGQQLSGSDTVNASRRSQLNTRLDLELLREFPEHNARFFGHVRMGSGSGLQINAPVFTGAVNTTSFAGSGDKLHDPKAIVAQAWVEVELVSLARGLSVVAGKIDPTIFFDHNDVAHDESQKFLNNIFVHNPLLDTGGNYGVDEYGFSPGAVLQYQTQHEDQPNWLWSLGAFGAGNGEALDKSPSNPFLIAQLRRFGEVLPGLQGSAALYRWINPKIENFVTGQVEKQAGWGFSGDQQLSEDLSLFGRLSYGASGTRNFDRAITYGFEYKGSCWSRPEDHVALALGHLQPDKNAVANGAPSSREHSMELMYVYNMAEDWTLAADYQRIQAPGGDAALPSVRVWGVRSTVKF